MKYQVIGVKKQDYSQLIEIWEKSVRATHDFLPEEEKVILPIRKIIGS